MSKDKYTSIFLKPNGDYCVYYPSNNFSQRAFGEYYRIFPSFSHVIRLDQSGASENL